MIELNNKIKLEIDTSSSKGNQIKWLYNGCYYKADNNGYEGLSEYVVSKLLEKSSLKRNEYVSYDIETIKYKLQTYNGCYSKNFLKDGSKLITIKRLLETFESFDVMEVYNGLETLKKKIEFIVNNVVNITGLTNFGEYLYKTCLIDALFLNDDRHLHNIAVIQNKDNTFDYCPIFDNGAALLSDTKVDYPLNYDTIELVKSVKSKTFNYEFMDIIDTLELMYGTNLMFTFNESDIDEVLDNVLVYDKQIIKRVKQVLKFQRNKMIYFFE